MIKIFNFLNFIWKKPNIIVVAGSGRRAALEAISHVLKKHFKIGKDVFIFETDFKDPQEFKKLQLLTKKSELPILVITQIGEIPTDRISFSGEEGKIIEIKEFIKTLPDKRYLVLNFDDDIVKNFKKENLANSLTFGFQEGADFACSDIKINGETNFKVNYDGKTVPFWMEKPLGKEQIYSILSAIAVGTILKLNLVEISQSLKGLTFVIE